ncbi:MAG: diacylglycerol kinase family protein [Planctomycetota bacterium]
MTTLSPANPESLPVSPRSPQEPKPSAVILFANPYSGSGPNDRWVETFAQSVADAGLTSRIVWDASARREVLRQAAQAQAASNAQNAAAPWIVAAGGDGSVAAVLNDMADAGVAHWPFATLPVGNENLFARHFGIDRKQPERLIEALQRGWTRPIDLGQICCGENTSGPVRFTLMASAGFDADVVHRVDRWRADAKESGQLRRVSLKSYIPRMLGSLRQYAYPRVTLTPTDGTHAGRPVTGRHVFLFNLPEYGKDLGLCRHARADDGQLDFVVFTQPGRARLLNYLRAAAMNARHLHRADVIHGQASRFTLSTDDDAPVPLQADGDPAGHVTQAAPVTITAEPAAAHVIHTTA